MNIGSSNTRTRKTLQRVTLPLAALLLVLGCAKPEVVKEDAATTTNAPLATPGTMPQTAPMAAQAPAATTDMTGMAAGPSGPITVADLHITPPAAWHSMESSGMRAAQYMIDGGAEAAVYFFGAGQGGNIDANIQRWLGQFSAMEGSPQTETRSAGDLTLTVVRARGTYESGMPGAATKAMPGHALVGIIVASPGGPVFIKITGPTAAVDGASGQVDELLRGIRTKV